MRLKADAVKAARLYYADKAVELGKPLELHLPPGGAEAIVLTLR